jgi:hypothetical protein
VVRKALLVLVPAALAALLGSQWRDIGRYVKIRRMSLGRGIRSTSPPGAARCRP